MKKTLKNLLTTRPHKFIINLCGRVGGDNISTRKKPGPHPEKPLDIALKIRIDKETDEKIKFCAESLKTSRSDVVRKGVHNLYEELKGK